MKGSSLRFYMHENQRHRGMLLYEWLLEEAKKRGIHGGSAFRAIAGFGRHGVISEQHFFELAGQQTVLVEFIASERESDELLRIVHEDGAHLFYARFPAEFGVIGEGNRDEEQGRTP
jgi:PII-like signaling protein